MKAATGWIARRYVLEGESARAGVAQVLQRRLPLGISVAYAPRGPLVEPADLPGAIRALRAALAAERCASLLCDPEVEDDPGLRARLAGAGVRPAPVFVQPRRTLLLDLSAEPDAMLAAMRKKTRQYIRKAERAGVVTEETADLGRFLAVLRRVADRDRFGIHDRPYFERLRVAFRDGCRLLMARVGADDAGALLVVRIGDRAWELYGGWSGDHAEERPFYLLKWRALMLMRELGVRRYDMWGLADRADGDGEGKGPRGGAPDDPLSGVENFKLGFGGDVVTWIGALETPVRSWLYPLWVYAGRRRLARSAA
ncbi:MAG TPA: peptidoglycan bridge formation glycyltransferase FemA/FemB family protein [Candidatus Limnocylindrales bacterium]|nr:peptidoglycan bridge formation glycyltransferase FemA/FemB family protein [Candidatus Limnocylindrales bacterium]